MRRIGRDEVRAMLEAAACDIEEANWGYEPHGGTPRYGLSQGGSARTARDVRTRNGISAPRGTRVRLVSGGSVLGDVNVEFEDGRRGTLRMEDLTAER